MSLGVGGVKASPSREFTIGNLYRQPVQELHYTLVFYNQVFCGLDLHPSQPTARLEVTQIGFSNSGLIWGYS